MQPNLGNRFQSYNLTEQEEVIAKAVNPYTYAFLHNKICAFALAIVEFSYEDLEIDKEKAILRHEKLKAQVEVLEELMRELTPPVEQPDHLDQI
jgi:hypothetical protein